MQNSRSVGLWCVVLSLSLSALGASARAEDELPPPPEASEELPALEGLDEGVTSGADLPPPPGADEPVSSADASMTEAPTDIPSNEEIPPLEELPAIDDGGVADAEMPTDGGMVDVPPPAVSAAPTRFSSSQEITDLSMEDRLKSKELVLWLTLGPSYGSLTTKGLYSTATEKAVGGMGYNAGIGFMIGSAFQAQFDMMGTPRTKRATVDQAMVGIGPRLGFITLMGLFGVQQGPDLSVAERPNTRLFSIGAKAGLDIIFSHSKDSRVSVGFAPEAFYITPQGADGYNNAGVSFSLRVYGYENAF